MNRNFPTLYAPENCPSYSRRSRSSTGYYRDLAEETYKLRKIIDHAEACKAMSKLELDVCIEKMLRSYEQELYDVPLGTCRFMGKHEIDFDEFPFFMFSAVHFVANSLDWDHLSVFLLMLTNVAAATHGKYQIEVNSDWVEAFVLYLIVSAESGSKKTALLKKIMGPLDDHEETLQAAHQSEPENGVENGSNYKHFPSLFFHETSIPKLYEKMKQQGGGCNHFDDEGNTFLTLINTPKAKLDIFAKAYDYGKHQYETKSAGTQSLRKVFMNIALLTNPGVVRQIYTSRRLSDNGITPRMLVCFGDKNRYNSRNSMLRPSLCESNFSIYCNMLRDLLKDCYTQDSPRTIQTLRLATDAEQELKEISDHYTKLLSRKSETEIGLRAHISKLSGMIVRIATALHIWENHKNIVQRPISKQNILLAEKLVHAAHGHAEYAFSVKGLQAHYSAAKVIEWIKRHRHARFTSSDVMQGVSSMNKESTHAALDYLEKINAIRQVVVPSKARQCVAHPDLLV